MITHSHYSVQCDMYSLIELLMLALRQACPPSSSENTTQVQAPIGSLTYAIQYAYRTLLHPSSSPQLRHPMLSVVEGTSGQPNLAKSTRRAHNKSQTQSGLHRLGAGNPSKCPEQSKSQLQMILPQVHLRKPCYDFSFL